MKFSRKSLFSILSDVNCGNIYGKIDMEAKIASFEVPALGVNSQLQLGAMNTIGIHNYHNAAVAALSVVGLNVGLDIEDIGPSIEKLRAPPHRMQIGKLKQTHLCK